MAATAAGSGALAGCAGLFEVQSRSEPPVPKNRPQAVYYPSHIERMKMIGMAGMSSSSKMQADSSMNMSHIQTSEGTRKMNGSRSVCALTYTYPHRFWTVTGDQTNKATIQKEDTVHLMVSVWDQKTGVYFMDTTPTVTVSQNGETVDTVRPWTMLSQNMGFHAGDNVSLPGGGTYSVTVEIPPTAARRTGAFEGKFTTQQSFEFDFEYSNQERNEIMFKLLEEKAGERGAVDPMNMEMMPFAFAPKKTALPGRIVGTKTSGDAEFVVTAIENASRFGADVKTYLAVSPRTPYNRYVLPSMSLSGTVTRHGTTVFDGALTATLDPKLDYHYGATVESIESGDEIEFTIDAPAQVTRHEGYETAFLDMLSMTMIVP
jgi:hypothetical protein